MKNYIGRVFYLGYRGSFFLVVNQLKYNHYEEDEFTLILHDGTAVNSYIAEDCGLWAE